MRQIIGATLVATPFVGLFTLAALDMGMLKTVAVFGAAGIVVGAIVGGVHLMMAE